MRLLAILKVCMQKFLKETNSNFKFRDFKTIGSYIRIDTCHKETDEVTSRRMMICIILLLQLTTAQKILDRPYKVNPTVLPRQNDKFLQKYPQVVFKLCFYIVYLRCYLYLFAFLKVYSTNNQGNGKSFVINEELAPNGITHGGYGYQSTNGDLVYVKYEKDSYGEM